MRLCVEKCKICRLINQYSTWPGFVKRWAMDMFNHFTWTIIKALYEPIHGSGYVDAWMIWKWERLYSAWTKGGEENGEVQ